MEGCVHRIPHRIDAMIEMIDVLVEYPLFDLPVARQHLRDTFIGIASYHILACTASDSGKEHFYKTNKKKYQKLGSEKCKEFIKLLKVVGSQNAPPVIACIKAEESAAATRTPSSNRRGIGSNDVAGTNKKSSTSSKVIKHTRKLYDKAIVQCTDAGMTHLAAIMNEWCGLYLLDMIVLPKGDGDGVIGEAYLKEAMRLYYQYGANGKVNQMKQKHVFLK